MNRATLKSNTGYPRLKHHYSFTKTDEIEVSPFWRNGLETTVKNIKWASSDEELPDNVRLLGWPGDRYTKKLLDTNEPPFDYSDVKLDNDEIKKILFSLYDIEVSDFGSYSVWEDDTDWT